MNRNKAVFITFLSLLVAGCGQSDRFTPSSRNDTSFFNAPLAPVASDERFLTEQAIALEDSVHNLMRTAKAGETAAPGCSGPLSDPTMAQCSEKQLLGRFIGGRGGLGKGKHIDATSVAPSLAQTYEQLDKVDTGVDDLLRQQSGEIIDLRAQHDAGILSEQGYNARITEIRQSRMAVAEALELTAAQASKAEAMFEKAQANGQPGLTWYALSMARIQEVTLAARARLAAGTTQS